MPIYYIKRSPGRLVTGAGLVLLMLGLAFGVLQAQREATAGYGGPRVYTQTLSADQWSQGKTTNLTVTGQGLTLTPESHYGIYVSPVVEIPHPFTGLGLHLDANWPPGANLVVEVRLRPVDGRWGPWQALEDFSPEADGRHYSDDLLFPTVPNTRQIQVRLSLLDDLQGASPQVRDLTLVAIDAQAGPTANEARAAAQARVQTLTEPGLPQPVIISRADWGADETDMTWSPDYQPVEKMILHHTVSGGTGDPAAEIRTIYHYHAVTRGWGDIGYNFLIDRAGNIYEGRYGGLDVIGAHAAYWNDGTLGMSALGCYHSSCSPTMYPTSQTLNAIADLVAWQASRRLIDPREQAWFFSPYLETYLYNHSLAGHRDYGSTACPGSYLYAELPSLRQVAWERLPQYDVRFDDLDLPQSLEKGQTLSVYPNLHNAGRLTWLAEEGLSLGYRWLRGETVVLSNTTATTLTADVPFGAMTALVAQLTAPSQVGDYTLRWDLYQPGAGWFSDQGPPAGRSQALDLSIQVTDPAQPTPTPSPTPRPVPPRAKAQLHPLAVPAGATGQYHLWLQGADGQTFDTHTQLPAGVIYAPWGSIGPQHQEIEWAGVFKAGSAQNTFTLFVSSALTTPASLHLTTTLTVTGYAPLQISRRLVVNGYLSFISILAKAPRPTATPVPPTATAIPPTSPPATAIPPTAVPPTAPPPPNCSDLVQNGGFETNGGWTLNTTAFPAAYSSAHHLTGTRSMRLGVPVDGTNTYSFSSIDQVVSIPVDATSVSLSYNLYPTSGDLSGDWFDFLIHDEQGWHWLTELRSDDQSWSLLGQDLSAYAGQTITLRFRIFNDGEGGKTAAWLDQVSLWVCTP